MNEPINPHHYQPTPLGVIAEELGEKAANKAINALVLHLMRKYNGGDAPGIVLRNGQLQFIELRKSAS